MPLDQDPKTVAGFNYAKWVDYERDDEGMVVTVTAAGGLEFVSQFGSSYRRGLVLGSVTVAPTGSLGVWGGVLDQPYVVVARLGPHTRYLYGANVKGLRPTLGRLFLGFSQFRVAPRQAEALPGTMELTAVFADGRRMDGSVEMAYEGEAPDFAPEWDASLARHRADRQAALQMPAQTPQEKRNRIARIVQASARVIEWTMSATEAEAVYNETRNMGIDRHQLNGLMTARMKGSFYQADGKLCAEMLKALRSAGAYPPPGDYLQCMQLLVNVENDVEGAWQIWEYYKADGEHFSDWDKKSAHYDDHLKTGPVLPRKRIAP